MSPNHKQIQRSLFKNQKSRQPYPITGGDHRNTFKWYKFYVSNVHLFLVLPKELWLETTTVSQTETITDLGDQWTQNI